MKARLFWEDTAERAIKTVAQTLVALLGAGAVGILDAPWVASLSAAGLAGALSVLTSIASSQVGSTSSPSLVTAEAGAAYDPPGKHAEDRA